MTGIWLALLAFANATALTLTPSAPLFFLLPCPAGLVNNPPSVRPLPLPYTSLVGVRFPPRPPCRGTPALRPDCPTHSTHRLHANRSHLRLGAPLVYVV